MSGRGEKAHLQEAGVVVPQAMSTVRRGSTSLEPRQRRRQRRVPVHTQHSLQISPQTSSSPTVPHVLLCLITGAHPAYHHVNKW